jgi:hypothetical protein
MQLHAELWGRRFTKSLIRAGDGLGDGLTLVDSQSQEGNRGQNLENMALLSSLILFRKFLISSS